MTAAETIAKELASATWNPTREAARLHSRLREVIDDDDHMAVRYLRDTLRLDPQEERDRRLVLDHWVLGWGGERGRWHHRLTFPYVTPEGIAGSCGRTLIDEADHHDDYPWQKWMTTRSKWGFEKRRHLWGLDPEALDHIRSEGTVILVEGAKDAVVIRALVPEAAACVAPVASRLTREQAGLLAQAGVRHVFLLADNDAGGAGFVENIRGVAARWPEMRFWDHSPALPEGKDPGDCNAEQLREALDWPDAKRLVGERPKPLKARSGDEADKWAAILRHPRNDLRACMAHYGVELWHDRGDCRFHDPEGSRNSLVVFEADEGGYLAWYCHSGRCQLGGNIIDFERHALNIDRTHAAARAAERAEEAT